MLQTFTFTGTGRQIDAKGTFFRYESGAAVGADASLRVMADGNDLGTYQPGDAIRLPVEAKRWNITPTSAACVGTVRIGVGRIESARLLGQVEVIDTSRALTESGVSFAGGMGYTASAGYFSRVALCNPVASGRLLVVEHVSVSSAGAQSIFIGFGAIPADSVANGSYSNKLVRGVPPAPVSLLRAFDAATFLGGNSGGWFTRNLTAGQGESIKLTAPYLIEAGKALLVTGSVVATHIDVSVETQERAA